MSLILLGNLNAISICSYSIHNCFLAIPVWLSDLVRGAPSLDVFVIRDKFVATIYIYMDMYIYRPDENLTNPLCWVLENAYCIHVDYYMYVLAFVFSI